MIVPPKKYGRPHGLHIPRHRNECQGLFTLLLAKLRHLDKNFTLGLPDLSGVQLPSRLMDFMGVPSLETITTTDDSRNDPGKTSDNPTTEITKCAFESLTGARPPIVNGDVVLNYPSGRFHAWGVVLGAILVQFCSLGYMCAFGVYQDYYTRVFMTEYSPSAISWIGSTGPFILFSSGLFVGRLCDRGYCTHLLCGGTFLISLSLFMLSLVKPNQYSAAFLCQGIGMGMGGGMIYYPSFVVVSQYFDKRRATVAMAMATAGVSLGATISPVILNHLLFETPNIFFGTVSRIYAGFITLILVLACCLLRPQVAPGNGHESIRNCLKRFSRDGAYVTLTIGFVFFGLAEFFPLFFLQLAATNNGSDKTFVFLSLVILNACGLFGRLICAFLSRKVEVDILAIGSMVGCGGIVFAFVTIGSKVSIVLVAVIYGIFFGTFVAAMAPLTASLAHNMDEIGLRLGIAYAFCGLADMLGPPIMGALLNDYQWWRPAVCAGTSLLAAAACFMAVRVILQRRKAQVKASDLE